MLEGDGTDDKLRQKDFEAAVSWSPESDMSETVVDVPFSLLFMDAEGPDPEGPVSEVFLPNFPNPKPNAAGDIIPIVEATLRA